LKIQRNERQILNLRKNKHIDLYKGLLYALTQILGRGISFQKGGFKLFILLTCSISGFSQVDSVSIDLVSNGDFSDNYADFNSDYDYKDDLKDGKFYTDDRTTDLKSFLLDFYDHTENNSSGRMIVANASRDANEDIWKNNYNTVAGQEYSLTFWFRSADNENPSVLAWMVNGSQVGTSLVANNSWQQVTVVYTATTSGLTTFSIRELTEEKDGNYFALDDVSIVTTIPTTCSGTFYDSGGGSNYSNDEDRVSTYCANYGQNIRFSFSQFNIEDGYDFLRIYDGENTSASLIGNYTDNNSPGTIISTDQCLTFRFTSDYSVNEAGWQAGISCITDPACSSIDQVVINDRSGGADIDITGGATVFEGQLPSSWNIHGTATGSVGSMRFEATGTVNQSQLESVAPYTFPGGDGPLTWTTGVYNIVVTLYSGSGGGGKVCDVEEFELIIEDCAIINLTASSNSEICTGQDLTLTATGGGTGAVYSWTGPNSFTSSSQNPTMVSPGVAASGNYQLTATNAGCSATATTEVVVNIAPTISVTSQNTTCGLNDGEITFSFLDVAGRTNIEFSTDDGSSYPTYVADNIGSTTVTGLGPATYAVWGRWGDNDCRVDLGDVTIVRQGGTLSTSPAPTICSGESTILTTSLDNGVGTINYSWSNGLGSGSSKTVSPISNVTYSVTGTDNEGCTATSTVAVSVNALPLVTVGSNSPVCAGATINLTSGGGTSYSWSGPNSFTSTSQNPNISSATPAMAGGYSVTVTNANGCTASSAINVVITTSFSITAGRVDGEICNGMDIELISSGANTYAWVGPGSFISTSQNPIITNATTSIEGPYTVTGTSVAGCTASATASVNVVDNNPTASNDGPKCQGSAINFSSSGGQSHSWTGPNSFTSTDRNPVLPTTSASSEGTYTVSITKTNACTRTATTELTLYALPNVSVTDPGAICRGDNMNLTSSGGTSYSWAGPNFFTSSLQNPVVTNMQDNKTGTYTVTVTNAQSCTATATTVASLSFPSLVVSGDTALCETGTIILNASGGISYSWVGPASFSSSSANNSIVNATSAAGGVYTVTVANALGCTATTGVDVTILSTSASIVSNAPICTGDTLSMEMLGWTTYSWTGPNSFTSSIEDPFIANATTTNSGTYSVTVSVAGCTTTATSSLVVSPLPGSSVSSNQPVCLGGTLNLTSSSANTYSWKGPDSFTSLSRNPSISVTDSLVQGIYTLVQTNAFGCVDSTTHEVDVSVVYPTAINSGTACVGSTVALAATGGSSYTWAGPNSFSSSSQNASIVSITTAFNGVYTATVTDVNTCTATSTTSVLVSVPAAVASSNSPVCVGQTLNFTGSTSTIYDWSGPNSFTSNLQNPTIPNIQTTGDGLYTYTITDSVSCTATDQITVVVNDLPTVTMGSNGSVCQGEDLLLTADGGVNYDWAGPNGFLSTTEDPTISNIAAAGNGVYTVQVTDINVCSNIGTLAVTVNPTPSITASAIIQDICVTQTINLQGGGGGTYAWTGPASFTSSSQNPSLTNAITGMTGVYSLTVTSVPEACTATATVAVSVNTIPPAPIALDVTYCGPGSVPLTASGCSGVYNWYDTDSSTTVLGTGANWSTPSISADRSYFVDCTEFTCPSSVREEVAIDILALPTATATSTDQHCKGSTAKFTGGGNNVSSYNWTGPTGFSDPSQNPTRLIAQNTDGGVYTLTTTRSNGCTATATTQLTVVSDCNNICGSQYVIIPTNPTSCGGSNGQVYIYATNSYETSLDGVNWSRGSITYTGLGVGNYFFYVKDYNTQNICKNVSNTLVSVSSSILTGSSVTSATDCYDENGSIQLQGVLGSDDVTWLATLKTPSVPVSSLTPANTITDLAPGKYYVKVSRANDFCYGEAYVDVPNSGTSCTSMIFCDDSGAPNLFPNGDFGSGAALNGPVLSDSQYGYSNYTCYAPWDGFYSIRNNTDCDGSGGKAFGHQSSGHWDVLTEDHTTGDTDGYMMVINAGYTPNIVIEKEIGDLCPNTEYNFTAWMRNISPTSTIQPDAAFIIDGVIVATSGQVTGSSWQQVGFSFKTGASTTSALFAMRNIAPGGFGNNFIIDDIRVSKCPLDITLSGTTVACLGSESEEISATVGDPYEEHIFYKWEKSDDNEATWQTEGTVAQGTYVSGIMDVSLTLPTPIPSALSGRIYRIRLATTAATIDDPACSVFTSLTQILVPPMQLVISNDTAKCLGVGDLTLTSVITGGDAPYTYTWANGLGNTASIQVNPTVDTEYIVTASDVNNCPATDTILVEVSTQPELTISIDQDSVCLDGDAEIVAVVQGGSGVFDYTWFSAMDTTGTWTELVGEKDSLLTLVTSVEGITYYRVFVEDLVFDCNDALSNAIGFTVFDNMEAYVSVNDTSFCLDGIYTLNAIIVGGAGGISYQWEKSANGINGWSVLTGETDPDLLVPSSSPGVDFYRFSAVSNLTGCFIPDSDSARVEVIDVFGVDLSLDNAQVCIGGSVELTADTTNGVGDVVYQWYSSPDGTSFSPISGETGLTYSPSTASASSNYYLVEATSAGIGCGTATSDSALVEILPVFSVEATVDNALTCIGGVVELLADTVNGMGAITYQWQSSTDDVVYNDISGETNINFLPNTSSIGTTYYRVQATASGSGCGTVTSSGATVEVLPVFSVDVSLLSKTVCIGGAVTLTADTTNGTGTVTYQWLESSDNSSFTPISGAASDTYSPNTGSAGQTYYRVDATASGAGCGTVSSASSIVEVLPVFSVDVAIDNAIVCLNGSAIITADTTSGTGTMTYQWYSSPDGNTFSPISGETGLTYTAPTSSVGTNYYQVEATASGAGCGTATSANGTVEVLPVFSVDAIVDNAIVCIDGLVELTADTTNGTGTIIYQWQSSLDGVSYTDISNATNINLFPSTSSVGTTYYRVEATASGSGCGTVTSSGATVEVLPVFSVDVSLLSNTVCIGGAVTLTADTTNGTGTVTYQWLESSDNSSFTPISGAASDTYSPNTGSAGQTYYRVDATASGAGCGTVSSASSIVEVLPVFSVDVAIDNGIVCTGGLVTLSADTVNGTGAVTYQWLNSADGITFGAISGATGLTYTAPTGSVGINYYRVEATASGSGCGTVTSASGTVEVFPQLSVSVVPSDATLCLGESLTLEVNPSDGYGTFTYQWQESSDDAAWSDISGATDTLYDPSTATAGIEYYRAVATPTSIGCFQDTSVSVEVTIYALPTVTVTSTDPLCILNNGQIAFSFNDEVNQSDIKFSIDGGITYPFDVADNLGSFSIDTLSSGTYDLFTIWGDDLCPIDLGPITLNDRPVPSVTTSFVDPTCTVDNGQITFNFADESTRTQIEFSLNGGITYLSPINDDSDSVSYGGLAPGVYDLWVRWENDECPVDLPDITLTDHAGPVLTVSTDTTICLGASAVLSVTSTGGDNPVIYTWNNSLPDGSSNSVSASVDTYYTITATDFNGCSSIDSILINVNPLPVITMTGGEYCEGDSIFLTGAGGVTYEWTGPNSFTSSDEDPTIPYASVDENGYFQLTITDANACQQTDSVEVIVNLAPNAPTLSDSFLCGPGEVTLTSSGCSGVTTWYDNQFSNTTVGLGTTFETISLVASRNYFASCTSASNCVSFNKTKAVAEIREASNAEVIPVNSTCVGEVALNNGILIITGFRDGEQYSFSEGTTYNSATSIPAPPQIIPLDGRVYGDIDNPVGPTSYYTVRIISTDGCPSDQTAEFQRQCEDCLPFCEPAEITKVK
jgi:hypothetical protein